MPSLATDFLCDDLLAKFWSTVDGTTKCWLWTGKPCKVGYGRITFAGTTMYSHILSWVIASGEPVPDGMQVLHICDNRLCIRNDDHGTYFIGEKEFPRFGHLFLGTMSDNIKDMWVKGRDCKNIARLRGDRHPNAKLTNYQVQLIRESPKLSVVLAAELGVSQSVIHLARTGRHYKNVAGVWSR